MIEATATSTATTPVAGPAAPAAGPAPTASGLRERKKARTREAIIEAALELFERDGFEATTVEDIAAAADVSPRTFFRYFDTKLDVVMARNVDDGFDLEPLVAAEEGVGPVEAVHQVIRRKLLAKLEQGDDSVLRELRVVLRSPELRSTCIERFHDHLDGLAAVFAERLGTEDDFAPYVMAGAVSATLLAVMDQWVAEGARTERLVPLLDEAFALLAGGLDEPAPAARP
ncbi:MAG TPA: TetR family transcriptional regulator [Acidimicrobiales bacterium]